MVVRVSGRRMTAMAFRCDTLRGLDSYPVFTVTIMGQIKDSNWRAMVNDNCCRWLCASRRPVDASC